jgi:hypothetical protein
MGVEEAVVIKLGMEFFQTNRVSQETFDVALEQFGPQGLVELTTLMGWIESSYQAVCRRGLHRRSRDPHEPTSGRLFQAPGGRVAFPP